LHQLRSSFPLFCWPLVGVAASNFPVMKAPAMQSQRAKPQSHKVVRFQP
jgi:hypothetical protein